MAATSKTATPPPNPQPEIEPDPGSAFLFSERAGRLADTARAHPKTAVAAGAALVAGAVAVAAAIPFVRARQQPSGSAKRTKKKAS